MGIPWLKSLLAWAEDHTSLCLRCTQRRQAPHSDWQAVSKASALTRQVTSRKEKEPVFLSLLAAVAHCWYFSLSPNLGGQFEATCLFCLGLISFIWETVLFWSFQQVGFQITFGMVHFSSELAKIFHFWPWLIYTNWVSLTAPCRNAPTLASGNKNEHSSRS